MNRRLFLQSAAVLPLPAAGARPSEIRKLKDVVVYSDRSFYSAFPSIVRRAPQENGEALLLHGRLKSAHYGED